MFQVFVYIWTNISFSIPFLSGLCVVIILSNQLICISTKNCLIPHDDELVIRLTVSSVLCFCFIQTHFGFACSNMVCINRLFMYVFLWKWVINRGILTFAWPLLLQTLFWFFKIDISSPKVLDTVISWLFGLKENNCYLKLYLCTKTR